MNTENKKLEEIIYSTKYYYEKYNKDENGELMRDAAAKDPMPNTLSPSPFPL